MAQWQHPEARNAHPNSPFTSTSGAGAGAFGAGGEGEFVHGTGGEWVDRNYADHADCRSFGTGSTFGPKSDTFTADVTYSLQTGTTFGDTTTCVRMTWDKTTTTGVRGFVFCGDTWPSTATVGTMKKLPPGIYTLSVPFRANKAIDGGGARLSVSIYDVSTGNRRTQVLSADNTAPANTIVRPTVQFEVRPNEGIRAKLVLASNVTTRALNDWMETGELDIAKQTTPRVGWFNPAGGRSLVWVGTAGESESVHAEPAQPGFPTSWVRKEWRQATTDTTWLGMGITGASGFTFPCTPGQEALVTAQVRHNLPGGSAHARLTFRDDSDTILELHDAAEQVGPGEVGSIALCYAAPAGTTKVEFRAELDGAAPQVGTYMYLADPVVVVADDQSLLEYYQRFTDFVGTPSAGWWRFLPGGSETIPGSHPTGASTFSATGFALGSPTTAQLFGTTGPTMAVPVAKSTVTTPAEASGSLTVTNTGTETMFLFSPTLTAGGAPPLDPGMEVEGAPVLTAGARSTTEQHRPGGVEAFVWVRPAQDTNVVLTLSGAVSATVSQRCAANQWSRLSASGHTDTGGEVTAIVIPGGQGWVFAPALPTSPPQKGWVIHPQSVHFEQNGDYVRPRATWDDGFVIGVTQPTAANTGVPAGTTLTTHPSTSTFTPTGVVTFEGVHFEHGVDLSAVEGLSVFRRCKFSGFAPDAGNTRGAVWYGNGPKNRTIPVVFEECEFVGEDQVWSVGAQGPAIALLRCTVDGLVSDAVKGQDGDMWLWGCFLKVKIFPNDPIHGGGPSHSDALQIDSGSKYDLWGNWLESPVWDGVNGSLTSGGHGVVISTNRSAVGDVTVRDNWFKGGYAAFTCWQNSAAVVAQSIPRLTVVGNRVDTTGLASKQSGGRTVYQAFLMNPGTARGAVFEGNVDHNGVPLKGDTIDGVKTPFYIAP